MWLGFYEFFPWTYGFKISDGQLLQELYLFLSQIISGSLQKQRFIPKTSPVCDNVCLCHTNMTVISTLCYVHEVNIIIVSHICTEYVEYFQYFIKYWEVKLSYIHVYWREHSWKSMEKALDVYFGMLSSCIWKFQNNANWFFL